MRSRPWIALLASACALVAAAAAAADTTQPEKVLLVQADVSTAKKIALQKADVGPGWKRHASSANSSSGAAGIGASGDAGCQTGIDLSRYTITGQSGSTYETKTADVGSAVVVFPTAAQATGDLAASMSPAARTCLVQEIAKGFDATVKAAGGSAVRFQIAATKLIPSSTFRRMHASHVYSFVISGRIVGPGGSIPLTTALLGFSKGRVAVLLYGSSLSHDPMLMAPLAKRMLARFPGSWIIAP